MLDAETVDGDDVSGAIALAVAAALFAAGRRCCARDRRPASRGVWAVVPGRRGRRLRSATPLALRGRGAPPPLEARPLDVSARRARRAERAGARRRSSRSTPDRSISSRSATAEGRLPNFGRILDAGAVMHLATLHPTSAEAVWAAVATGKLPQKNGVRSAGRLPARRPAATRSRLLPDFCFAQRPGAVRLADRGAAHARRRFAHAHAVEHPERCSASASASSNWPLTYPAPAVRGYRRQRSLSARRARRRPASTIRRLSIRRSCRPRRLRGRAGARRPSADAGRRGDARARAAPSCPAATDRVYDRHRAVRSAAQPARAGDASCATRASIRSATTSCATRCRREFGDVTDDERRRFGRVLESHYGLIDEAIGRAIGGARPGRSAAGRVGLRHGAARPRQAAARAGASAIPTSAARTRPRRTAS